MLDFIPLIDNGIVLWKVPILTTMPESRCDIILNDKMHFTDFSSLQRYVINKRGKDL